MKKKNWFLIVLALIVMFLMPISTQAASAPGTVRLTKITATDYNKINIKWSKTSGATNYIVYYKKTGASKWIKVKTLDNTKSSYTHTASTKYPIVVGQKYQYTVKAYNKKTKKSGGYNTKGLTTRTIPQTVKNMKAVCNKDGSVTLSWSKAGGADAYLIYARNYNNTAWSPIDTTSKLTYTDREAIKGQENIYTVCARTKSGILGKYDSKGVKVYVSINTSDGDDKDPEEPSKPTPKPTQTPTPKPTTTPKPKLTEEQFAAEIFRLTNVERAKYGEPQVQYNEDLHKAAMERAKEISIKFSHTRPDGTNALTVFDNYGIPDYHAAENISAGYMTPQAAVDGWMGSSGHRVSLLNTYSTHLGVGVCKSGDVYYCVQLFTAFGEKEKLTIDANGGCFPTLNNVSVYDMYFYHGTRLKLTRDVPTPIRTGYKFAGWAWYDTDVDGIRITSEVSVKAKWEPVN